MLWTSFNPVSPLKAAYLHEGGPSAITDAEVTTVSRYRSQEGMTHFMAIVLLVGENETSRDIISRRLQRRGCAVEVAGNAADAVRIASALRPDVILMDLCSPDDEGRTIALALKENSKTRSIPIIALTENSTSEERKPLFESGCHSFETKPINLGQLLGKMELLIGRKIENSDGPPRSVPQKRPRD
jgi:two-component system, cell cycle response regulator DivK